MRQYVLIADIDGGDYGTWIAVDAFRRAAADHSGDLDVRRAELAEPMMGYAQFLILFQQGHWVLRSSQTGEEAFPDHSSATRAAVEAAHESGRDGLPGAVILQTGEDDYEVVWRYGLDHYPVEGYSVH